MDLASVWPIDDSLEDQLLRRGASLVLPGGLRRSDHLAQVVVPSRRAVIATQRGKCGHHAVLPNETELQVFVTLAKGAAVVAVSYAPILR